MSEDRQHLSSSSSNLSEAPMTYKCRKCPGDRIFTKEELPDHRKIHKIEKARAKLKRPSSAGTLFTQAKAQPTSKKEEPAKKKKESRKHYDFSVESVRSSGS